MPDFSETAMLTDGSIQAGVRALEQLHRRHLEDMTPAESDEARLYWRHQVERILAAAHAHVTGDDTVDDGSRGRAVVSYADNPDGGIDVSAAFLPSLSEQPDGELEGTPAQTVAIVSLQSLEDEDQGLTSA